MEGSFGLVAGTATGGRGLCCLNSRWGKGEGDVRPPGGRMKIGKKKRGTEGYCGPLRCDRSTSVAEDIVVG
jgi:hypothetical protein